MKFVAQFVHLLLWLSVAMSPTLFFTMLGLILVYSSEGQMGEFTVPMMALVGFVLGAIWAERVRKTVGLSNFFGRLVGMRNG
ncbi:hypothetical protein [Shewanella sp. KT0246]|uniref:hypothetical protein n=1 Tax=Shewanella sp. KT0246 TaxID=2815912 RepID=UPI001BBB5E3F|nr:hypothetical protein [Shewanella sp. KT0246]GIU49509.1 hypothetical protein TUM4249_07410 [Shewanella sp. KT0246]